MITWRDVTGHHSTADVRLGTTTIARLHAYPTHWRLEFLDGIVGSPANSIGQAKRAALEALGEWLGKAAFDVEVALRSA